MATFFSRAAGASRAAALLMVLALTGASAAAQAFPQRAIRIVYPFAAGTGGDLIARTVAQKMAEETGQPVVVENRVGASGVIGTMVAARAAPDGYTILMGVSPFTIAPSIDPKVGYDPSKDFVPVAKIVTAPLLLAVNADLPFKSLRELVDFAKANPKKLSYGSSGPGTSAQIELEILKKAAGIEVLEVPYTNTSQLVGDLLEGRVSMYAGVAPVVMPHVQSGRLRVLAVVDTRRSQALPDVQTVPEGLGRPDYVATPNWYGFLAPQGTPPELVERLQSLILRTLDTPEMQQVLQRFGAQRYTPNNETFAKEIRAEVERTTAVAKELAARK